MSDTSSIIALVETCRELGLTANETVAEILKAIALGSLPYCSTADVLSVVSDGYATRPKDNHQQEQRQQPTEDGPEEGPLLALPRWETIRVADPPKRAPVLVEGVLRRGHVALISGKAKSGKSWLAIQLAIAVATGGPWIGFECQRGRVLFVDPEIDRPSLDQRFAKVCGELGADSSEVEGRIDKWCLRGVTTAKGEPPFIDTLASDMEASCTHGDFDLIIIDSCSCFLRGDENSSVDVRRFFSHVHRIIAATGAAVLLVHHFGKGDAGDRSSIDRSRGSSVWGDAPDAPLSLTEVFPSDGKPSDYLTDGERALVLEGDGLREFRGLDPRRIIWRYPCHRLDSEGVTDEWKPRSGQRDGGKASGDARKAKAVARSLKCQATILAHLYQFGIGEEGIAASEAARICSEAIGESISSTALKAYAEEWDLVDVWQRSPKRCSFVARHVRRGEEQLL